MTQKKRGLKWILKFVLGLLIFLGIVIISGDLRDIRQLLYINWYQAWQVLLWTLIINMLAALRLHVMFKRLLKKNSFLTLFKFLIIGRAVGHTTSQLMGDLGSRFVYLKSRGIKLKQGMLTILIDKLLEGMLFLAIGAVFLGMVVFKGISIYLYYAPVVAVFLFIAGIWLLPGVFSFLEKFLPNKNLSQELKTILSGRTRLLLVTLTLGKYSASVARFMVIMKLSGIDISLIKVFIGTSVAQIGLIAGITPGGLGLVEAGWASAFYGFGISSPAIPGFLVTQRLLIFASILLLSFLFIIHEVLSRKLSSAPEKDEIAINLQLKKKN